MFVLPTIPVQEARGNSTWPPLVPNQTKLSRKFQVYAHNSRSLRAAIQAPWFSSSFACVDKETHRLSTAVARQTGACSGEYTCTTMKTNTHAPVLSFAVSNQYQDCYSQIALQHAPDPGNVDEARSLTPIIDLNVVSHATVCCRHDVLFGSNLLDSTYCIFDSCLPLLPSCPLLLESFRLVSQERDTCGNSTLLQDIPHSKQ